jgi:hypothetical protein
MYCRECRICAVMAGLVMVEVVLGTTILFLPWMLPLPLLGLELGGEAMGVVVVEAPVLEANEVKLGVVVVMLDDAVVTTLLLLLLAVAEEVGVDVLEALDADVKVRSTDVSAVVYKTNRSPDTVSKLYRQAAPVLTSCTSPLPSSSLGLNLPHNSRNDKSIPNMSFN